MTFVVAFALAGCVIGEGRTELSFSEVVRVENNFDGTTRASSRSPSLAVASRSEEVSQFANLVDQSQFGDLTKVDFTEQFLVLARLGNQPTAHYSITIDRISRSGSTLYIHAIVSKPKPDILAETLETSPYHLVRVDRTGDWNGDFEFALEIDGETVATLSHFVP